MTINNFMWCTLLLLFLHFNILPSLHPSLPLPSLPPL